MSGCNRCTITIKVVIHFLYMMVVSSILFLAVLCILFFIVTRVVSGYFLYFFLAVMWNYFFILQLYIGVFVDNLRRSTAVAINLPSEFIEVPRMSKTIMNVLTLTMPFSKRSGVSDDIQINWREYEKRIKAAAPIKFIKVWSRFRRRAQVPRLSRSITSISKVLHFRL